MDKNENLLVVCVDRDNDLGRKTGIPGPVIGRSACINAGARLAIADPSDSDSNSIFGAIKKFDEVKAHANAEVALLTGEGKTGFESDRRIRQQLEAVLEKFPATGFVLVTDGAEDDQVIPLLLSRAPIVSKETIIVSQASEMESTYFTIKRTLNDPEFARTFILMPGIIILLGAVFAFFNMQELFIESVLALIGAYFVLKGTGLEQRLVGAVSSVANSLSLQRVSFPLYLLTILFFFFGLWASFTEFSIPGRALSEKILEPLGQMLFYLLLTSLLFIAGKGVDAIQLKKAYYLRKYFLSGAAVLVLWFTLDSARQVIAAKPYADITWFATNAMISFIFAVAAYKVSEVLDLRKKITKLLIGLPVYSKDGKWIGSVESIEGRKAIEYKNRLTSKTTKLRHGEFMLSEGKVVLN